MDNDAQGDVQAQVKAKDDPALVVEPMQQEQEQQHKDELKESKATASRPGTSDAKDPHENNNNNNFKDDAKDPPAAKDDQDIVTGQVSDQHSVAPVTAGLDPSLVARFDRCHSHTTGTELDLSQLALQTFPREAFARFPMLRKLNVRDNALTQLPHDFARKFPWLVTLNLSQNKLVELPQQFTGMRHLQKLSLQHNQLTKLPETFSTLDALEEVNLSQNCLQSLDEVNFSRLKRLKVLLLAQNQLHGGVPRSLCDVPHLQVVDLTGNGEMTNLPEKIKRLHEKNVILHSRAKRHELITRALRVKSAVAAILHS